MDEREFLALAKFLVVQTGQAAWRSGISRAYYAAFHVARRLLEDIGFVVPRAERAHSYLWLRLTNCGDATVQRAASNLNSLRGQRNRADYDLQQPLKQTTAQAQVQVAEQIIQLLDSIVDPMRTQIRDEMKKYERDVLKDVTWRP
jgi:uncharacterized protein (UPF0332 family)